MKMKCAIFESKWGTKSAWSSEPNDHDFYRISEWVEVEFPELSKEQVVVNQVRLIDKEVNDVAAKAEQVISGLKQKREELLALPTPEQS